MRAALLVFLLAIACGPIDESGAPSVIPPAPDGGTAGPPPPPPLVDGGVPDAGPVTGANDCDGVLPGKTDRGESATVPHSGGQACWYFTSDLAGDVAAEAHSGDGSSPSMNGAWHVWSANGSHLGSFNAGTNVLGQSAGFQSAVKGALVAFTPDGRAARSTPLDKGGCSALAYNAVPGGTLVIDSCPGTLTAWRFDAQGNSLASRTIANAGNAWGLVDAQNRAFIVVADANGRATARWYDAGLAPLSAPFGVPDVDGPVSIRPLVGGGAALQIGGVWAGVSPSGSGSLDAPPAWLAAHSNFDVQLVRGGTAYVCLPKSGAPSRDTLDLVSASGSSCGSLRFPISGLSMGPDGTVIGSSGDNGCTTTWWSALLR
ncbi:MAG: hypothetical protein ABR567_07225 [Myxococcales bacterium]